MFLGDNTSFAYINFHFQASNGSLEGHRRAKDFANGMAEKGSPDSFTILNTRYTLYGKVYYTPPEGSHHFSISKIHHHK
jgi:hypothetical protein